MTSVTELARSHHDLFQSEDWDRGHLSWYKVNFAFIIPLLFISFLKLIDEMILNSQKKIKKNKSTVANIGLKPTSSGNSVNGLFVAKNRNKWTGSTCDKFLQSIFYYLRRYTWIRGFAGRCDWFLFRNIKKWLVQMRAKYKVHI